MRTRRYKTSRRLGGTWTVKSNVWKAAVNMSMEELEAMLNQPSTEEGQSVTRPRRDKVELWAKAMATIICGGITIVIVLSIAAAIKYTWKALFG